MNVIEIKHDKSIIQDWITHLDLTVNPTIIQTGEYSEITATGTDDLNNAVAGQTVYFYEILTPNLSNFVATPNIIQTGEYSEFTCKVKDEDGSLAKGVKVFFYKIEEE